MCVGEGREGVGGGTSLAQPSVVEYHTDTDRQTLRQTDRHGVPWWSVFLPCFLPVFYTHTQTHTEHILRGSPVFRLDGRWVGR